MKIYIQPTITIESIISGFVCAVNSVQGVDLNLGGGSDPGSAAPIDPM